MKRHQQFQNCGFNVVLIGLGSSKTALKYVGHLSFPGKIVVDPELLTYVAAGMEKQPDAVKGFKADGAAAKKLSSITDGKIQAEKFLIGSGITNAGQNGGFVCITRDLKQLPFYYVSNGSWDMPDLDRVLEILAQVKLE